MSKPWKISGFVQERWILGIVPTEIYGMGVIRRNSWYTIVFYGIFGCPIFRSNLDSHCPWKSALVPGWVRGHRGEAQNRVRQALDVLGGLHIAAKILASTNREWPNADPKGIAIRLIGAFRRSHRHAQLKFWLNIFPCIFGIIQDCLPQNSIASAVSDVCVQFRNILEALACPVGAEPPIPRFGDAGRLCQA